MAVYSVGIKSILDPVQDDISHCHGEIKRRADDVCYLDKRSCEVSRWWGCWSANDVVGEGEECVDAWMRYRLRVNLHVFESQPIVFLSSQIIRVFFYFTFRKFFTSVDPVNTVKNVYFISHQTMYCCNISML